MARWTLCEKDRLLAKTRLEGECWVWTAQRDPQGYGRCHFRGTHRLAHRASYIVHRGFVPAGMDLDHLCRNRACINPAHLEPVTHRENVRRGQAGPLIRQRSAAQTHCKRGHMFDQENTRRRPSGSRECKSCKRDWLRNKRAATRAKCVLAILEE